MGEHGVPSWEQIAASSRRHCPKLVSHWNFRTVAMCDRKEAAIRRPTTAGALCRHCRCATAASTRWPSACSCFCGTFAKATSSAWIDRRLASVPNGARRLPLSLGPGADRPMRGIHGASDKVLNMALSDFLLGARLRNASSGSWPAATWWRSTAWCTTCCTGPAHWPSCAEHAYGPACYRPGRMRRLVRRLAHEIDASAIDPSFPKVFPRLVQHALWHFCAQDGLNICNGVQIDDERRCENSICPVFDSLRPCQLAQRRCQQALARDGKKTSSSAA